MKTISDQAARQFSHAEMIQLVEDKTLSMSSPSFMKKKCYPLHTESNTDPTLSLSDYSIISNKVFKEMLLTTISTDTDDNSLDKLLDIEETLIFIRQLTQLLNKLNYFKLQGEQSTYFYNLGMTEGIWTGRVSKNMAIINSMSYSYGRSKVLIEQRHKKCKKDLQKIQIDIDEHMQQIPLSTVDMDKLMTILIDLVHVNQYELRMKLERRRVF